MKTKQLNFNEIYNQYYNEVLRYVNMKTKNIETSKDITIDVFIKVNEFLNIFDSGKAQFNTWLYTIVNNKIIDYWRLNQKKRLNTTYISDYVNENGNEYFEISDNSNNSDNIEIEQTNEKVKQALNKLKPQYKKVAELFFIKELKYTEIADILQIPLNSVKVNLLRAKEMLQKELKPQYELIYQ